MKYDKKQISPIRPEPYGDRFIEFIEGITKSPEEAQREKENVPQPTVPHTNSNTFSNRNTASTESPRRRSDSQNMRSSASNTTVQRNENDAMRGESRGEHESDRPDPRTIMTVRSPSAERTNGMQGQILPVVEEMGEASSSGGRSTRSRERDENGGRPLTPAKDNVDERPITPAKDYSPTGFGSARTPISRSSLDKDLPPLPPVTSPVEMNGNESTFR
jgi:1-phosphatidylinositol-4-phosphate 5-kinase